MSVSPQLLAVLAIWSTCGVVGYALVRRWTIRHRVENRLWAELTPIEQERQLETDLSGNFLERWLFVAGFRKPNAVTLFIITSTAGLLTGGVVVAAAYWSGTVGSFERLLTLIPGGVGEVFLPVAWASPWAAASLLGLLPMLYVRAQRRQRVQQVEQDLPLMLDLLATLAESGLSFDAALDRILLAQPSSRPLAEDLRLFQVDVLAGRQRIDALRRLMRRVDVPWFSIFVSAVMHAEQVGSGLAATLRTQADDLRMRRRERALALAMAVPVKLLLPLIVCFLPGILTAALGPIFYQIVQVLESFLRGALGG